MAKTRSSRAGSALSDHAAVRGVRQGRSNQRKGQRRQHVLRALRRGVVVVTGVVAVAAAGVGAYKAWGWAHTAPYFAIKQIQVQGMNRASEASLRRRADLNVGENIFAVDTDALVEAVGAHPWVAEVTVQKRYPRNLVITVREHEPVVLVALGHLYYADASSEIVKRYAPGEQESLPVVTGLSRAQVENDDPDARAMLSEAVAFVDVWKQTLGETAPRVVEMNMDPVMGLSVVLDKEEGRIEMGHGPWAPKIERWVTVQQTLAARGVKASRIILSGTRRPERVVAKLATQPGVAAAGRAPAALSPQRSSGGAVAGNNDGAWAGRGQ